MWKRKRKKALLLTVVVVVGFRGMNESSIVSLVFMDA